MAITKWCVALKAYLRQCGAGSLRMLPREGWIVLADGTGEIGAVLIGADHFPPREALRSACRAAAPLTRVA